MITFEKLKANFKREHGDRVCYRCHKPAFDRCYSEAGLREVTISGMCEKGFDEICKALEEDV